MPAIDAMRMVALTVVEARRPDASSGPMSREAAFAAPL
jgi:hypothetical protein